MTENIESKQEAPVNVVRIGTLDELKLYTAYQPDSKNSVAPGFVLAEPVLNERDILVYPAGTEITYKEISRLAQLQETSAHFTPAFVLQKNIQLIKNCRERLTREFQRLIDSKKRNAKYADFMKDIEKTLNFYMDGILGSDDVVYALSQMRLDEQRQGQNSSSTRFFNHCIHTMLYSLGIAKNSHRITNYQSDDYIALAKAALFQSIGSIGRMDDLIGLETESLVRRFYEVNLESHGYLAEFGFEPKIANIIRKANEYFIGKIDFVLGKDNSDMASSIILTASIFDTLESGLLGDPKPLKDILEDMYERSLTGKLRKEFIDGLAAALKQKPLVDFYGELDKLKNSCTLKKPDKYPSPYPLTGFKSAVVFLCKGNCTQCPDFGSNKAVNVVKKTSGLEPGSYGMCIKMTIGLRAFYQRFYPDIKAAVQSQDD
jgi:hypothetical protein